MVQFERFILKNGLRVIVHTDKSTPMATVNVLYDVGARDEMPEKTGFAHLFEHLMFSGSTNVPDFDIPVQMAGGDCNAFTNNDVTNYYDFAPAENVETLLWLESDRMSGLNINEKSLDVQRKVVVEEFNETCLNVPYGDSWHLLMDMCYKQHPYRWPTIGLEPSHISDSTLEDVRSFYKRYYCPDNAILVIAGNIEADEGRKLAEKYFGDIPPSGFQKRELPKEEKQADPRKIISEQNIPLDAIFIAFHIPARMDEGYYAADILSDLLGSGKSARLNKGLRKRKHLFMEIDAYVTGSFDPGLLIIEGKVAENVSIEEAEKEIWNILEEIKLNPIAENELDKLKNKALSALIFNENNLLNRSMSLAFYECLGDANYINQEAIKYEALNAEILFNAAKEIFRKENSNTLVYKKRIDAN